MRSVSFDVDGTLIDNKSIVREAYALAGVELTDAEWESCFGKTFSEWLVEYCDGNYERAWDVHCRKNEHYRSLIKSQRGRDHVLAPALLAYQLYQSGHDVYIITGASKVAAVTILDFLDLQVIPPANVTAALSIEDKISRVCDLDAVHIDDDIRIVDGLYEHGHPFVVHYKIGDSLRDLRETVQRLWTR